MRTYGVFGDLLLNFLLNSVTVKKLEELQKDTDLLYPAFADELFLGGCIQPETKTKLDSCGQKIASIVSLIRQPEKLSSECAVTRTKNMKREILCCSKRSSVAQRCFNYVSKPTGAMLLPRPRLNSVAEV